MKYFLKFSLLTLLILSFFKCKQPTDTLKIKEEKRKKIEIITNYGSMVFELYNSTPLHRDNIVNLANNKAYDSLLFHRIINEFMIQTGDPESKNAQPKDTLGNGDAPYLVNAEFRKELFHKKGALAAAREDNPKKSSSAMHFYIVQGKKFNDSLLSLAENRINKKKARAYFKNDIRKKPLIDSIQYASDHYDVLKERYNLLMDSILSIANNDKNFKSYIIPEKQREVYKSIGGTPHLDQDYTVFGQLIKGMNVLDSIASVPTNDLARPLKDVRIQSIKVIN
ncbi:peptidylprolyl isomerase [Lacinutrix sp. Bg11-31]|uniref:peptidylprolyl isomerase n=1 Tax=Lacinutrix sp. Bg11-31 TaxID=2057808 RepID=UPI000C31B88D|nr:peptidylprolyl isomerase [Lacinutrix sp. Bg11-31]AUC80697.1 peptidylprolyl isomerase [Lacinutrix sp. Bg11-31]